MDHVECLGCIGFDPILRGNKFEYYIADSKNFFKFVLCEKCARRIRAEEIDILTGNFYPIYKMHFLKNKTESRNTEITGGFALGEIPIFYISRETALKYIKNIVRELDDLQKGYEMRKLNLDIF